MSYCKPVLIKTKKRSMSFVTEKRFFGLMLTQMRRLAFNLAERNEISHNFNKSIKDGRLRLALRVSQETPINTSASPKPTSLAGTKGILPNSCETVLLFVIFFVWQKNSLQTEVIMLMKLKFRPYPVSRLKRLDWAARGLSSDERGVLVTAEIFMTASGNFVPTMFVFPRNREN
jgi:hypothetical protein